MKEVVKGKSRVVDSWCPYLMFGDNHAASCGVSTNTAHAIESRCATEDFDRCTLFLSRLLMRSGKAA